MSPGETSSRQCRRTLSMYFYIDGRMLGQLLQLRPVGRRSMLCPAWEARWHPACSGHMDWCPEDYSAKIPAVTWLPCCRPSAALPTRPAIFLTFYGINPLLLQTDQARICCWQPRSLADILNDSQQMYVPRREVEARSCSPWDPGDWSWPFGFHNARQKPRILLHQDHTQWGRGKFQKEQRLLLNEECGSTVTKTGHMCANQSLFIQVNRVCSLCAGNGSLPSFLYTTRTLQAGCKQTL